ncbi:DMT family transporter [Mesorhizobium sp. B2-1-3A]|uniref:DMT family transporter n=1 Tax=Mesorhizobium sp. B2-1-3A TaxID=2589971 RepID=UPI0011285B28|nr:DMT family transporter [Mesorhizobium sp. B2-1-3A]TPM92112.1 DMT family transporter [Mesorhizobium sp. B2-1-3A]
MYLSEILSIGAALCIATSGMLAGELVGRIDALTLTRLQTLAVTVATAITATVLGGWGGLVPWQVAYLAASGVFGIFVASSAYISSIFALGPRLALLVFSLTSPFALIMGYVFLDETVGPVKLTGVALVIAGIVLAILFGRPAKVQPEGIFPTPPIETPVLPEKQMTLPVGLVFGLIAALGQAAGALVARPVMASGVNPFTAMAIRTGVSAALFLLLLVVPLRSAAKRSQPSARTLGIGIGGALIGTGMGMSLIMAALAGGKVGIVSTLSSLSPVLVLPMVWLRSGYRPPAPAWAGAVLAFAGTSLIALG